MGEQGSKPPVPPAGDPGEDAPEGESQVDPAHVPDPGSHAETADDSGAAEPDTEAGSDVGPDPEAQTPPEPEAQTDAGAQARAGAEADAGERDTEGDGGAAVPDESGDVREVEADELEDFDDEDVDDDEDETGADAAHTDEFEDDDADYEDGDFRNEVEEDGAEDYDEFDDEFEDEDADGESRPLVAARQLWHDRGTRILSRALAATTFAAAGFLAVTSSVSAEGTDLRAERQTDVADLARAQVQHNRALDADLSKLRRDVDKLLKRQLGDANAATAQKQSRRLAPIAGLTALTGPGVRVTLDDAPASSRSADIDPDALVVHQQDLQGVVNALWAGGAEALTLQGQRIISTSAIRCVGNTVRVNGLPYSPPYQIEAIGDVNGMVKALSESPAVQTYLSYVKAPYGLGWKLHQAPKLRVPAFDGSLSLDYAEDRGAVSSGGTGND